MCSSVSPGVAFARRLMIVSTDGPSPTLAEVPTFILAGHEVRLPLAVINYDLTSLVIDQLNSNDMGPLRSRLPPRHPIAPPAGASLSRHGRAVRRHARPPAVSRRGAEGVVEAASACAAHVEVRYSQRSLRLTAKLSRPPRTDTPTFTFCTRCATKADVIPLSTPVMGKDGVERREITVGKGDHIVMPFLLVNRDKAVWGEDADEFK